MVLYLYCHDKYEKQLCNKSKSKVIAAEGEHKASRALRHAAEVIAESPSALQVNIEISCFKNECLASWSWIYHIIWVSVISYYITAWHYLTSDITMIAVAVSSNVEQHQCGEELHNNLPSPCQ